MAWRGALRRTTGAQQALWKTLPFGAIVAVCHLVDCRPSGSFTRAEIDTPRRPPGIVADDDFFDWTEGQMGDFALGRFGWVLDDIRPLRDPLAWKGLQGLFEVPDDIAGLAFHPAPPPAGANHG